MATCSNTKGGFACKCNQGTTGDGNSCVDIDECSTKQHDCSYIGECTNTEGSFTCACANKYIKRGYRGSGKKGDCCKMDGRGNRIGECH